MRVATKSPGERSDEEARRLVRPPSKKKPPRKDRRRERMQDESDPDLDSDPDLKDKDLSLNYKDADSVVKDAKTHGLIDPQSPADPTLIGGERDVDARHITLAREAEIVDVARDILSEVKDAEWGEACEFRYSLDHAINQLYGQSKISAFLYDRMLRTLKGEEQPWPRVARVVRMARDEMAKIDPVLAYELNDVVIQIERQGASERLGEAFKALASDQPRLKSLQGLLTAGLANTSGTCEKIHWSRIALTIDQTVRSMLTGDSHVHIARDVAPSRFNALYASLFRTMLAAAHQSLSEAYKPST